MNGPSGLTDQWTEGGMNAILIAEDETRIAAFIEKGLKAAGLTPWSTTARQRSTMR